MYTVYIPVAAGRVTGGHGRQPILQAAWRAGSMASGWLLSGLLVCCSIPLHASSLSPPCAVRLLPLNLIGSPFA